MDFLQFLTAIDGFLWFLTAIDGFLQFLTAIDGFLLGKCKSAPRQG
jgi:hypothetical protein